MRSVIMATLGLLLGYMLYGFIFMGMADISEKGYAAQMRVHCGSNVTYTTADCR